MTDLPQIKVGDVYFVFDVNNRVYEKDVRALHLGGPIYRKYFVETEITGETSRSWIVGHFGRKVPKSHPWGVFYTQEMVDDKCWDNDNRGGIVDLISQRRAVDTNELKRVAELIGYTEDKK